ncbi:MAG: serine/threonine protein kinase [Phycisphaerales bacterium]|nr:serine/threonine protein kinase [Phycisphaerales bacterium]MCB9855476.1 serine/threonine protein kinase [Phycisphaerales bacterium]MCB9864253.1 serine/threonine protein kinase [Phycisphaerales bacterium]
MANLPNRYRRTMEIFDDVCELPSEERSSRLADLCEGDSEIRREVEALLAADAGEHRLVDSAESGQSLERIAEAIEFAPDVVAQASQEIGAYRIVREIGRGGMGIIYEARQESPSRRVALKVLRPGLVDREMLKRFQHEAHVLGQLQHSGIAQIFEAGVADTPLGEQPFLVMELIEGEPLDRAAASKNLNTRGRLELIARVCDAVQHAHQKGIIHRDLKPSNVLVVAPANDSGVLSKKKTVSGVTAIVDGIGQPKVLDFGIARVTDSDMKTVTVQTEVGQLVGTLAYMSPEQVAGDSSNLDTRCDVYALGVMLYELLVGRRPHDISGVSPAEAARRIQEEEPPRLGAIDKRLRGDVETIVAKALEKDSDRRYGSAAEMAADIRRFLNDQPIEARPASTFYQIGKFARRNKGLVAGICTTLLALTAGLIATGVSLKRANEATELAKSESKRAQEESEQTQKALDDVQLVSCFQDAIINRINVREMGETILNEIRSQVAGNETDQELDAMIAKVNPATLARAVVDGSILSGASRAAREQFADRPELQSIILESLCETYHALGMYERALTEALDSLALRRASLGDDHPATIKMIGNVAFMYNNLNRLSEAEPLAEEALRRRRATLPEDDRLVLEAVYRLCITKTNLGKLDEAIEMSERLVETADRALPPEDHHRLMYRQLLAGNYMQAGRIEDALPIRQQLLEDFRRLRGENDPMTLSVWSQIAGTLKRLGRLQEAEAAFIQVLDRAGKSLGETDPRTLIVLNQLAALQQQMGKREEAISSYRALLEHRRRALPPDDPAIQDTLAALEALGDSPEQPRE